ncbi:MULTISPECIES: hypothetical protein [unclassified Brevundimonas]|uniref:hypothetical protein n=1 Tax=unclassified Brevundimonas TaxID=2622653 RepID=UPI0025C59279|nr:MULTISPECIES: hypothetical protein [unclassified Brevundimonas]
MIKSISAKRRTYLAIAAGAAITFGMVPVANAADGPSMTFRLNARVASFCRISAPFDGLPVPSSSVQDNSIDLGAVREICNSGSGYRVEARFMNVRSGTLMIDETPRNVTDGVAFYTNPQAARQVQLWRLADFETTASDEPILVRLSISPL